MIMPPSSTSSQRLDGNCIVFMARMDERLNRRVTGRTYSARCHECFELLTITGKSFKAKLVTCPNGCYEASFANHLAQTGEFTYARESKDHYKLKEKAADWLEE